MEVIKRDGIMVSDQLRLRQLGDEKIDQGRQGIPLRNIEAGVHHLPAEVIVHRFKIFMMLILIKSFVTGG